MSRELKCAELSGWVDLTYKYVYQKAEFQTWQKKKIFMSGIYIFFIAVQLKMHAEEDVSASETFAHLQKSRVFWFRYLHMSKCLFEQHMDIVDNGHPGHVIQSHPSRRLSA